MNILRGDIARLQRCTAINTGSEERISRWRRISGITSSVRCKPFKYTYEKEIVMYAYFKKLDYFSTECIYSPNAYRQGSGGAGQCMRPPPRGHARAYIKDVEKIRSTAIIDIIHSGEQLTVGEKAKARCPEQGVCRQCGYISSQEVASPGSAVGRCSGVQGVRAAGRAEQGPAPAGGG
jgi:cytoplasmic tRNA 2-thiolation protein 1